MPVAQSLIRQAEEKMQKTLQRMSADFGTLRTGRASAALVENVRVEYYGTLTPMNQLTNISAPEPRVLEIRAWDKSALPQIEKAIFKSELGVTPTSDGSVIRLQIPPLTEERRKDLIKVVRKMAEEYRVSLRNERRDAVELLKKSQKAKEISEDDRLSGEQTVQKMTDAYIKLIEDHLAAKERDILEV